MADGENEEDLKNDDDQHLLANNNNKSSPTPNSKMDKPIFSESDEDQNYS